MSSRRSVQPLLQQVAAKGEKLFAELHAKQADQGDGGWRRRAEVEYGVEQADQQADAEEIR